MLASLEEAATKIVQAKMDAVRLESFVNCAIGVLQSPSTSDSTKVSATLHLLKVATDQEEP